MKKVTAVTLFNSGEGMRISIMFSELDETGKVINDNSRIDRVILSSDALSLVDSINSYAQTIIDSEV